MGQYWKIINIDYQETTGHLGKLGEFFWYDSDLITSLLIAPVIPPRFQSIPPVSQARVSKVMTSRSSATLLTLPVELLRAIAEELMDDYLALICFSVTCVSMWEVTQPVRYNLLQSVLNYRSWAGSRIILLGDHARALPEGTLTDEEIEELVSNNEEEEELENDIANLGRYLNDASDYFQRASLKLIFFDDEEVSLRKNPSLYMQLMYLPPPFRYWLSFFWEQFMPKRTEGDSWVVRNFTKREFVAKSRPRHLTSVLFSLIGCSDKSLSMLGGDWLVDGAWAGDSIDITLASIHEQEHGNETDWKDITAEVKQKLEILASKESRPFEF
ncbi:hypothetical protein DFJ43DRAFT_1105879 [Lentinula guzmanii]|uniref:Uncharacterized protein n=1 Tax=Lentinula guzmanii TaxID=2804957 RepID=A0AA38JD71_9AGAR|nr:hypothetical protein DFJ43DRAFT_1105879 [Lentinula guzmanii]